MKDVERAISLYKRAIDAGTLVYSMYCLSMILAEAIVDCALIDVMKNMAVIHHTGNEFRKIFSRQ